MEKISLGNDILLNKRFQPEEILFVLSHIFEIDEHFVFVQKLEDIEVSIPQSIKIYCLINNIEGDFKEQLSIFIKTSELTYNPVKLTTEIAKLLDVVCLISDTDSDPYSMILINSKGDIKDVVLNPHDLDDDIYNILKI